MAWSAEFVRALRANVRSPMFCLRQLKIDAAPGHYIAVSSHRGGEGYVGIVRVATQSSRLMPRSVTSQIGGFSVEITGASAIRDVMGAMVRGTPVELLCGFDGMAYDQWERIAIGVVRDTELTRSSLVVQAQDILAGFRQRFDPDATYASLFSDINGGGTTLDGGYTAGDTTITVASTSGFALETGGTGAIRIGSFYLTYTGTTATTFTGVSATAILGTAANTSSGALVYRTAYLTGHPLDIARKILVSTGGGTNGAYDTYPAYWSLAVPTEIIDHDDIDAWKQVAKVSSGSYSWGLLESATQADAYAWLSGTLLGPGGFYLAVRQGQITARALQDPYQDHARAFGNLSLDDLEDYVVRGYDGDHTPEYCATRAITASGFTDEATATAATMPTERRRDLDVSARVRSNESAVRTEMLARLAPTFNRVPERIEATGTMRLAQFGPGDALDLIDERILTRSLVVHSKASRKVVVDSAGIGWSLGSSGKVTLTGLVYPDDEVFP